MCFSRSLGSRLHLADSLTGHRPPNKLLLFNGANHHCTSVPKEASEKVPKPPKKNNKQIPTPKKTSQKNFIIECIEILRKKKKNIATKISPQKKRQKKKNTKSHPPNIPNPIPQHWALPNAPSDPLPSTDQA